jgi:hypothetical protein
VPAVLRVPSLPHARTQLIVRFYILCEFCLAVITCCMNNYKDVLFYSGSKICLKWYHINIRTFGCYAVFVFGNLKF